jgi:hypothetical protein
MAKIHLDPWTDIVGVGWNGARYLVTTYQIYMAHVLTNSDTDWYDGWPSLGLGYLPPPYDGGDVNLLDPTTWTNFWTRQHGVGYYNGGFNWTRFSTTAPSFVTNRTLARYSATGQSLGNTATLTLSNLPDGVLNMPAIKTYEAIAERPLWVPPYTGTAHPRATWQYLGRPWTTATIRAVQWKMRPITSSPSTVYQIASGGGDLGGRIGIVGADETITRTLDFSNVSTVLNVGGTNRTFRCTGLILPQTTGFTLLGPFDFNDLAITPVVSTTPFLTSCIAYLLLEREDFIP